MSFFFLPLKYSIRARRKKITMSYVNWREKGPNIGLFRNSCLGFVHANITNAFPALGMCLTPCCELFWCIYIHIMNWRYCVCANLNFSLHTYSAKFVFCHPDDTTQIYFTCSRREINVTLMDVQ